MNVCNFEMVSNKNITSLESWNEKLHNGRSLRMIESSMETSTEASKPTKVSNNLSTSPTNIPRKTVAKMFH